MTKFKESGVSRYMCDHLCKRVLFLVLLVSVLAACREDLNDQDTLQAKSADSDAPAPPDDHQLIPVAGPDEAFFASHFLETALGQSADTDELVAAIHFVETKVDQIKLEAGRFPSFDFRRNFSHDRLQIMKDYIFYVNDQSADGGLRKHELTGVKLDPKVLGNPGTVREFSINKLVHQHLADRDGIVGERELEILLLALGHLIESSKSFSLSSQDYRKSLLDRWDLVIAEFDENKDGILDLDEYQALRDQRRSKLEALRSNLCLRSR